MSEGTFQDQIQWLVRKSTPIEAGQRTITAFTVLGPYLTDQVREMLRSGILEIDDELSPENGYWFGMHEAVEIRRFFGAEQVVVAKPNTDEEVTQPDLETTQPSFVAPEDERTPSSIENVTGTPGAGYNPDATGVLTVKRTPAPKPAAAAKAPGAGAQAAGPAAAAPAANRPPAAQAAQTVAPAPRPAPQPKIDSAKELARQYQRVVPQSTPVAPAPAQNVEDSAPGAAFLGMEKGSILAVLIVAGLVMAALGVIWVLKSFRT